MHRRANDAGAIKIRCYGSVTRGTKGEQLTEMGLLADAGAVAARVCRAGLHVDVEPMPR